MPDVSDSEGKSVSTAPAIERTRKEIISGIIERLISHKQRHDLPDPWALIELKRLGDITPQEVVSAIFEYPPAVNHNGTVLRPTINSPIPPTNQEKEYAEKQIDVDTLPISLDYKEAFNDSITIIKKYLKTPKIKDSFTSHTKQRRPWQKAIEDALLIIDLRKNPYQKPTEHGIFVKEWSDKWGKNKYSRTCMNWVDMGIMILDSILEDNPESELYKQIKSKADEYTALEVRQNQEEIDENIDRDPLEERDIDKVADNITNIAIETIDILDKAQNRTTT